MCQVLFFLYACTCASASALAQAQARKRACARAHLLHGFARALATWACYMLHTLAATWLTRSLVFQILAWCVPGSWLSFCSWDRAVNHSLMRVWLLALLLLATFGVESWPEARLAPGFALARDSWLGILAWCASGSWLCSSNPGLIRVWLQVFRQNILFYYRIFWNIL